MNWLRALPLVWIVFAVSFLLAAVAKDRLRVQTPGRFATAPAEWYVRVWLDPTEQDRNLRIIVDGPDYHTYSKTLYGLDSAKVYQVWMKPTLGTGCWEFSAEVRARDEDGPIIAQASSPYPLSVSGPGTSGDVCSPPAE